MAIQKALALTVAGPRPEEVAEAAARLRVAEAQLAFLQQQLADAQLVAPVHGIVRTRLMEPGEMASPQKPVFSLAVTDPKWVRAYVSEPDLGKVSPGMMASVVVDSFPERRFEGWVGFISPVAEFTPKAVQTEELRTSLVYEVSVFVKDPGDAFRLGMPGHRLPAVTKTAPSSRRAPKAEGNNESCWQATHRSSVAATSTSRSAAIRAMSSRRSTVSLSTSATGRSQPWLDRTGLARPRSSVWPPG